MIFGYALPMQRALPVIVFIIVLGVARIVGALSSGNLANLQPLGALFFCGMALFGWRAILLPAAVWAITYPITNDYNEVSMGAEVFTPVLGFAAMIGIACFFKKASTGKIFAGSLASAVAFYFITNTLSWATSPLYAPHSIATFVQSQWTGVPGFPPAWMFFRNALIGQALFTGIYLFAIRAVVAVPVKSTQPVLCD